jgi:hypothetical protein
MTQPEFNFGMGGEAAEEASKSLGGKFAKVEFFNLEKDGDTCYLRMLTDSPGWVFVKQHAGVPTKGAPQGYTGKWPVSMPATCRYDAGFGGYYKDCYPCDHTEITDKWGNPLKPTVRVWALACLREEVFGDGSEAMGGPEMRGKRLGFKDAIREVAERDAEGKETGNTIKERRIIVVNMAMKNFFGGLQGIFGIYGTVCDRDYIVRRRGLGKDTDYDIMPMDVIEGIAPGTERWKQYEESIEQQNLNLKAIIADRASDDYFARFFDPSKAAPAQAGGTPAASGDAPQGAPVEQQQAASTPEVSGDALAAMRDRVRSHVPSTGTPASEPATASAGAAAPASSGPKDFG